MEAFRNPRRSLVSCERGLAYVEFALVYTLLMLLFMGSVEITRYALVAQKLEMVVQSVANVTTQTDPNGNPLTTAQLSAMMGSVGNMMSPYTFGANGYVILTNVTKTGTNNPVINWQYCGGGTLPSTQSRLGYVVGGTANVNAAVPGFTMIAGEEVVFAEIFYRYVPITGTKWSVVGTTNLYRTSVYMPRLGALTGFSSHC